MSGMVEVLAHAGDFHPSQLLILLGMGLGPALVIVIALLIAGRRKEDSDEHR
ncbi:MAG: hypothetical protein ACRDT6_15985 [Micromonosporaceae bacterium]